MPINKHTIFFESEGDYCDNSWALYQYIRDKYQNRYKFVWLVSNSQKFTSTGDTTFVSWNNNYFRVCYYYATARFIMYTHCMFRSYKKRSKQLVVDLEHGCGFKAGKDSSGNYCDIALVTGRFAKKAFSIYLCCDEKKVMPLGYPRNDILVSNIGSGKDNPIYKKHQFRKIIIWMPTFRASINKNLSEKSVDTETGLPLISTPMHLNLLNEDLKKHDVLIILKVHHLQADKPVFHNKYSNIDIITDPILATKGLQLYQFIGKTDALLTDYSSISIDYTLCDKPIGYILDDYEEYNKSRGFKFDNVKDLMPGNHIYDYDGLLEFITQVSNNVDLHAEKRNQLSHFFHDTERGKNCETLCKYLNL